MIAVCATAEGYEEGQQRQVEGRVEVYRHRPFAPAHAQVLSYEHLRAAPLPDCSRGVCHTARVFLEEEKEEEEEDDEEEEIIESDAVSEVR